jgi:hypothetical protein
MTARLRRRRGSTLVRSAWWLAVFPAAGCFGTAVDVLQRADAGDAPDGMQAEVAADDGTPGEAEAADGGGEAATCRAGAAGDCPLGQVCDVRSCAAGAAGSCVAVSAVCTADWVPVCGCAGKTYWNDCERRAGGTAWSRDGACDATPCEPFIGLGCGTGEICAVIGCVPGMAGTCAARPRNCASGGAPACGCDGVTYADPCAALDGDMPLNHAGACAALPCMPVCETLSGGGTAWRNRCGDTTLCAADCAGCSAVCLLSGTSAEGWYSFCFPDLGRDGGCGGTYPDLIALGACGS